MVFQKLMRYTLNMTCESKKKNHTHFALGISRKFIAIFLRRKKTKECCIFVVSGTSEDSKLFSIQCLELIWNKSV